MNVLNSDIKSKQQSPVLTVAEVLILQIANGISTRAKGMIYQSVVNIVEMPKKLCSISHSHIIGQV